MTGLSYKRKIGKNLVAKCILSRYNNLFSFCLNVMNTLRCYSPLCWRSLARAILFCFYSRQQPNQFFPSSALYVPDLQSTRSASLCSMLLQPLSIQVLLWSTGRPKFRDTAARMISRLNYLRKSTVVRKPSGNASCHEMNNIRSTKG